MNLGVFLSSGSSFSKLASKGRDELLKSYLVKYCQSFNRVYVFSYHKEKRTDLPENCFLIDNQCNLPRAIYTFLLPFLAKKELKQCQVLRIMQLTGAVPAIIAGKIYKIPTVSTYGYDYLKFAKMEKKFISFWLLKILKPLILKNLSVIITTTHFLQKKLKKKINKPVFLIPNSVNTNLFKPKNKVFDKKKIKILSVGRLEKQKNLDSLIKAISFSKYKKNIYLTLIGNGSLRLFLIKLAKKRNINLKILNKISYNQMPKYYQQADIFCLISFIEGHPKALIEALSCGLPSIVSKNKGNLSIAEDKETALVVDFNNNDIADKIDLLINREKLRDNLSKNGREKVIKLFNRDKLLNKEIKILKNV